MPITRRNTLLYELAELAGIETSYIDMKGQVVTASADSVLALLQALGVVVRDAGDARRALGAYRAESSRAINPVFVAWDGIVRLHKFSKSGRATLLLENGTNARWPASKLPLGYHQLIVEQSGSTQTSLIISAPKKADFPREKTWGTFAPAYALHSERSFGAGDLTDLENLLTWTAEAGGHVVSTLPLLAAFLDQPFEPSPYSPASRLFWNEFFLDLERSPEFSLSQEAQRLFKIRPRTTGLVNYRGLMTAKRRVLEAMCRTFFSQTPRNLDFQMFAAGSEVGCYAEFRAATERQGRGWRKWPERMRGGIIEKDDRDEAAVQYHLYAQWLMHQQLQALGERSRQAAMKLYLDLPLGIHTEGYDTWRYPQLFLEGVAGGAPPDPVFTTGQNWAFRPMHPHAIRADHYRYVIALIRNHLRYTQLLRVDHVMGLHHLFCIPDGMDGRAGLYLKYPADELYAILALESHRHGAGIVGEDLGLVPAFVRRSMKQHNIRGMYILQVEPRLRPGEPLLRTPPAGSVASMNTHDMFPFAAYLDGKDIEDRLELRFLTRQEAGRERSRRRRIRKGLAKFIGQKRVEPQQIFEGCMDFMVGSNASVVLVNLEDLWLETRPQNIPATTKERPNWRRRMRYSMEELRRSKRIKQILETMRRKV